MKKSEVKGGWHLQINVQHLSELSCSKKIYSLSLVKYMSVRDFVCLH